MFLLDFACVVTNGSSDISCSQRVSGGEFRKKVKQTWP